jgi:hypothetical protein
MAQQGRHVRDQTARLEFPISNALGWFSWPKKEFDALFITVPVLGAKEG